MIPGVRLIMLGRQGAGKGTQCVRLSRHYVVPHISTGDMLRAAVREGTDLGRRAEAIMRDGQLVPDDLMVEAVRVRLTKPDALRRGYVLDGFPRTVAQAEALEEITSGLPLDLVVELDVARETVLERLSARRVCADCGTNYSTSGHERPPWLCDNCGGDVIQRHDDRPEAINRRLDDYETKTKPLASFYGGQGRFVNVDGLGSPDEVFIRLVAAIDARSHLGAAWAP